MKMRWNKCNKLVQTVGAPLKPLGEPEKQEENKRKIPQIFQNFGVCCKPDLIFCAFCLVQTTGPHPIETLLKTSITKRKIPQTIQNFVFCKSDPVLLSLCVGADYETSLP